MNVVVCHMAGRHSVATTGKLHAPYPGVFIERLPHAKDLPPSKANEIAEAWRLARVEPERSLSRLGQSRGQARPGAGRSRLRGVRTGVQGQAGRLGRGQWCGTRAGPGDQTVRGDR